MQSSKAGPLIAAGAAGFALGYAASSFLRSSHAPAVSAPSLAEQKPMVNDAGEFPFIREIRSTISEHSANESVPNTPRGSVASEGLRMKMALLVENVTDGDGMPRGRTAALVAHAVLQQYKKLFRKRDPARGVWDKDGGVKELFEGNQEQLAACRLAAKLEGIPTFQVNDPILGKAVLCIGPAGGDAIRAIVGELTELA